MDFFARGDLQIFIILQLCATPGGVMLWEHQGKAYVVEKKGRGGKEKIGKRTLKKKKEKKGGGDDAF